MRPTPTPHASNLPPPHCILPRLAPLLQIQQVDAEGLEAEIMNRDRPLIIDFYATW